MAEEKSPPVTHGILAYLADHPDAQDTLAGIAKWWLLEQQIKTEIAAVREALDRLVWSGLVLQRTGQDSQIHYRVNNNKLAEIHELLKEDSPRHE